MGPMYFRSYGGFETIKSATSLLSIDAGDVHVAQQHSEHSVQLMTSIHNQVSDLCKNANTLPIFFGGDHSLAMSTMSGFLADKKSDEYVLIWIDAHADCNTFETSPSKNVHGMPVAALLGDLPGYEKMNCLKPEQIFYLALRDVDEGEENYLKARNIQAADI